MFDLGLCRKNAEGCCVPKPAAYGLQNLFSLASLRCDELNKQCRYNFV
jgi:hypothetical protein